MPVPAGCDVDLALPYPLGGVNSGRGLVTLIVTRDFDVDAQKIAQHVSDLLQPSTVPASEFRSFLWGKRCRQLPLHPRIELVIYCQHSILQSGNLLLGNPLASVGHRLFSKSMPSALLDFRLVDRSLRIEPPRLLGPLTGYGQPTTNRSLVELNSTVDAVVNAVSNATRIWRARQMHAHQTQVARERSGRKRNHTSGLTRLGLHAPASSFYVGRHNPLLESERRRLEIKRVARAQFHSAPNIHHVNYLRRSHTRAIATAVAISNPCLNGIYETHDLTRLPTSAGRQTGPPFVGYLRRRVLRNPPHRLRSGFALSCASQSSGSRSPFMRLWRGQDATMLFMWSAPPFTRGTSWSA